MAQGGADETPMVANAVRAYRFTTQRMLVTCSEVIAPRHKVRRSDAARTDYRACVASAIADATAKLETTVRSMGPCDSATALRSYHAAFVRALAGIAPVDEESDAVYDERQTFLFHRLAHAWARFELAETLVENSAR